MDFDTFYKMMCCHPVIGAEQMASASSSGFPENSGLNETSLSVPLAVMVAMDLVALLGLQQVEGD